MTTSETQLINRALELVRDGLRSGEIPAENFNMGTWFMGNSDSPDCGTVACIGGWTELLLTRAGFLEADAYAFDDKLFWPPFRSRITANEAADAIDRYLAGQEPWPARRWAEIDGGDAAWIARTAGTTNGATRIMTKLTPEQERLFELARSGNPKPLADYIRTMPNDEFNADKALRNAVADYLEKL